MAKKVTLESIDSTLYDLMDVMQKGFLRLEDRADHADIRFDKIDYRLEALETGVYKLDQRMGKMEVNMEDMRDSMVEFSETVRTHEGRITHLEKKSFV